MSTTYDRYLRARRLFDERRYLHAAHELEQLLDGPLIGSGEARVLLGRAYYHAASLGRAEGIARDVVESDPTDTDALRLLVRVLQRRGRHAEAAGYLRRLDGLGVDTWSDPGPRVPGVHGAA